MRENLSLDRFMDGLIRRNPGEVEFHQAVHEVMESIIPFAMENERYRKESLLERMTEPDRTVIFRVVWEDDDGNMRVNRGYRVQFNNSIGPYKGGLRFHPSVNLSILKFLGFEQTFKNSLTGLPMGAGKGGSDFNPRGKSDREVMRFCQAYMSELYHHIGANIDVPAGDIGVGAREISYMFGQYKRLAREFTGVLTGKALEFGGSLIRKEATGYGAAFFMSEMLKHAGLDFVGKSCVVSGSGNVATYCAEKIHHLGGKVIAMSDSGGYVHDPVGIAGERLDFIIDLKTKRRGSLREYAEHYGCDYFEDAKPWGIPCDLAFPCATQNEIGAAEAQQLVGNGCLAVSEGANMPTNNEGVRILQEAGVLFAPGKAANAGGVAVSGLEMSQNSIRVSWTADELEARLRTIMSGIHAQCVKHGQAPGGIDYVRGANVAGFIKVADAMIAYGVM
jgi:glutamate dehydrogenase (NADP+)